MCKLTSSGLADKQKKKLSDQTRKKGRNYKNTRVTPLKK